MSESEKHHLFCEDLELCSKWCIFDATIRDRLCKSYRTIHIEK